MLGIKHKISHIIGTQKAKQLVDTILDTRIYALGIVVGIITAAVCIPFRMLVSEAAIIRENLFSHDSPAYYHPLLLISMYIIIVGIYKLTQKYPSLGGSGIPQTQALIYGRMKYDRIFDHLFVKFIGGVASIGVGLSLGREGPSVQMGSFVGNWAASKFKVRIGEQRHLIAAGAGAGVAAAFTAPLASSMLVIESLEKFNAAKTTISTLLAGATAGILAQLFVPNNIYDSIIVAAPDVSFQKLLLIFFAMAIFMSILGKGFSHLLLYSKKIFQRSNASIYERLAYLTLLTWSIGFVYPTVIGGDQNFMIQETAQANPNMIFIGFMVLLMMIFTTVSAATYFPGGVFLPMMTVGGLAGNFFTLALIKLGIVSAESLGYFTLIGMSACFISVVRTPLTGFILISEMTGHYDVFFATLIVGVFTYYITELIGVVPMNKKLYDFMINENASKYPPRTTMDLQVNSNSYLEGKDHNTLKLPNGCVVLDVYRNNEKIDFNSNITLEKNDQIVLELDSADLEKLHLPLVSMSLDNS